MSFADVDRIYTYNISFCPGYDPGSNKREHRLFQLILERYPAMNGAATDHKQTLVIVSPLTQNNSDTNIDVVY
jgi:hypothetical protein